MRYASEDDMVMDPQRGIVCVDRVPGDGYYVFPSNDIGDQAKYPDTRDGRADAERHAARVAAMLRIDWETNYQP